MTCYRYIELNPVRAGMVHQSGDYPYSSYARNATVHLDELTPEHPIYKALATTPDMRQTAYRALFSDAIVSELLETIRDTTNACRILGNDRFKDQIDAMLKRSVRRGKAGRPRKHAP